MHQFHRIAAGIDVTPLLAALDRNPELWNQITARQTTPGSPHSETESVFLRWAKTQSIEAVFNEIPAVDYPAINELIEARRLIAYVLAVTNAKELGRVLIVNLKPKGFITKHADEGSYADYYERFHLSLASDEGNAFFSQIGEEHSETAHMKPGELWWFDHKSPHWVLNSSDKPRLHLIIDAVAPDYRRERRAISA